MKIPKLAQFALLLMTMIFCLKGSGQINPGVYISDLDNVRHELKISDNYFIHTIYEQAPARFIKTVGGFYSLNNNLLKVVLEFNSNHEGDSQEKLDLPFAVEGDKLVLGTSPKLNFSQVEELQQDLDGQWLFATRGPDSGQERRGDENPRKTLKYLQDNRFQWIAYNTETFKFHGTGGGSFSSDDGVYVEKIEFFSRDDSRVGAELKFEYELKGDDWHHKGKNSKGEPMYEIWSRRK